MRFLLKFQFVFCLLFCVLVSCGDDGDPGPAGSDGTNGIDGLNGEDGTDGADGNANVELFIFPGHDFSDTSLKTVNLAGFSEEEMERSSFLVFLKSIQVTGDFYYSIPGSGFQGTSEYRSYHVFSTSAELTRLSIDLTSGPGEAFDAFHIFRIEASSVTDNSRTNFGLPENLDVNDYHAIMAYYGL